MIHLIKKNQNGKDVFWQGITKKNVIHISYGVVGGKIVSIEKVIKSGKNIGKKNETTPNEQALLELNSIAQKKIEGGYKPTKNSDAVTIDIKKNKVQISTAPVPMTAYVANDHIKKISNQKLYIQYKYDGFRCIYDIKLKKLYSRSQKEFVSLPSLVEYLANSIPKNYPFDFLDGELYSHNLSFEKISSIVASRKTIPDIETQEMIKFVAFDTFTIGDTSTFEVRYNTLINSQIDTLLSKSSSTTSNRLEIAPLYVIEPQIFIDPTLPQLKNNLQSAETAGYEGIMIRLNKPYEHRRSYSIYKLKSFFDMEGECIGFKEEENKYGVLGAVIFKLSNGITVEGRPAMTVEEKAEIWNNKKKYLGKMGTLKYQELTNATGAPRFPVFTHWRPTIDIGK
jgi:DNA ligase-1